MIAGLELIVFIEYVG